MAEKVVYVKRRKAKTKKDKKKSKKKKAKRSSGYNFRTDQRPRPKEPKIDRRAQAGPRRGPLPGMAGYVAPSGGGASLSFNPSFYLSRELGPAGTGGFVSRMRGGAPSPSPSPSPAPAPAPAPAQPPQRRRAASRSSSVSSRMSTSSLQSSVSSRRSDSVTPSEAEQMDADPTETPSEDLGRGSTVIANTSSPVSEGSLTDFATIPLPFRPLWHEKVRASSAFNVPGHNVVRPEPAPAPVPRAQSSASEPAPGGSPTQSIKDFIDNQPDQSLNARLGRGEQEFRFSGGGRADTPSSLPGGGGADTPSSLPGGGGANTPNSIQDEGGNLDDSQLERRSSAVEEVPRIRLGYDDLDEYHRNRRAGRVSEASNESVDTLASVSSAASETEAYDPYSDSGETVAYDVRPNYTRQLQSFNNPGRQENTSSTLQGSIPQVDLTPRSNTRAYNFESQPRRSARMAGNFEGQALPPPPPGPPPPGAEYAE